MSITLNISFDTLLETIRNLETSEKQQLWDFLEAELEIDDLDAQEEREVALAYQEYEAGDYLTLHLQNNRHYGILSVLSMQISWGKLNKLMRL
jgi:hypothetical protein